MQEIDKLPSGIKIAIYGAGEAGRSIKNYILTNRSDLSINCFFDEKVKGQIDGINIHHIKDIQSFVNSFDVVIPASFLNSHLMEAILIHYGVNNYIKITNIPRINCSLPNVKDPRLDKVKDILSSDRSKQMFELIVNANTDSCFCSCLFDYIRSQENADFSSKGQYLDFINCDYIKTAISGGAADARTTLVFLEKFKNLEKIYAFEPLYQTLKKVTNDTLIKESGKVEIVEKGLFNESIKTNIIINGTASRINSYLSSEITQEIQTISIDEFVKEKSIKKIDFIKMDIEGAELNALKGAEKTILSHRPYLAICIYHSYNELFDIPLYLSELLSDYTFEVYHHSLYSNSESVLYAIPNELIKNF